MADDQIEKLRELDEQLRRPARVFLQNGEQNRHGVDGDDRLAQLRVLAVDREDFERLPHLLHVLRIVLQRDEHQLRLLHRERQRCGRQLRVIALKQRRGPLPDHQALRAEAQRALQNARHGRRKPRLAVVGVDDEENVGLDERQVVCVLVEVVGGDVDDVVALAGFETLRHEEGVDEEERADDLGNVAVLADEQRDVLHGEHVLQALQAGLLATESGEARQRLPVNYGVGDALQGAEREDDLFPRRIQGDVVCR